jgi:hypothetical protein
MIDLASRAPRPVAGLGGSRRLVMIAAMAGKTIPVAGS